MLNRIKNSLKIRIKRVIDYNKFYKISLKELKEKTKKNHKKIWFIGSAHYNNIGDLAISDATVKFIKENVKNCELIEIRLCDYYKYLKAIKKLINKDDIIVMQGGGNMGYKYFEAEINRRSVIKNFKNNKIIIFPSTIDYGKSAREKIELKKSIRIYNKSKKIVICAREEKSYDFMKKIYKSVILVPDIVLSLNFIQLNQERKKIILCLRNDTEKTELSDKLFKHFSKNTEYVFTDNIAKENNISISERKEIFYNKLKEYASAKIVITDRLHTMIFCTLTETPCLFLDNSNGKVYGVYKKWIEEKCNYIKKIDINRDIEEQILEMYKLEVKHLSDFKENFEILLKLFNEREE